ncbi:MAG: hypothetical protein WC661_19880 [Opitutaceae bacterium]|jgi:hypothetical protein
MNSRFLIRRAVFMAVLLAVSAFIVVWHARLLPTHPHLVYLTGWSLLGLMLYLTAYNSRKKLSFLPLVSSRLWLQMHIYLGLLTGLVFLLHSRWRWPTGWFESLLSALFVGVTLSGLVGWWISRTIPKQLTTVGGEVPYERIPIIRRSLREQAEGLVIKGIPTAKASTLADFYAGRLAGYFAAENHFWAHVFGSRRSLNTLLDQLAELGRFLNAEEKKTVGQLADLVKQKDALDFHAAKQFLLRAWLFVHIPLTYGLLVFSFVHVVLVYAYSGGAR